MSQPNVLLVLTDQQRGDVVAPDSPVDTPFTDRVADRGVQFDRCYAPNTVCSPSRASLMTGELPHTHGMTHVSHTVPAHQAEFQADLPTWSERLQAAGYDNGYVGKWHVERESGPSGFGFDLSLPYGSETFTAAFEDYLAANDLDAPYDFSGSVADSTATDEHRPADGTLDDGGLDLSYTLRTAGYDDSLVYGTYHSDGAATRDHYAVERSRSFLEDRADEDEPWCLVVSTFGPHDPFVVPQDYYDRYDPDSIALPESFDDDLDDKPHVYERMRSVWDDMEPQHVREATACYYAYCTYLEERFATLLDTLEATGQREDTVVVATSDHGEQLGAHGLMYKGLPAFEETYHVPLSVSHPDGPDGAVCGGLAQSLDLAPTLAEVAGGEAVDTYGTSLAPVIRGEAADTDRSVAIGECFGQRYYWTHRVCWNEDAKYVFNPGGVDECYDLDADPHELDNLAADPTAEDEALIESMAGRLFGELRASGDETLVNTNYPTMRYAPGGPAGPGDED